MPSFVLYESPVGYAIFQHKESDEIAGSLKAVQKSIQEFKAFSKLLSLFSFQPFDNSKTSLESLTAIAEGELPESLSNFLQAIEFPKKSQLEIIDPKLGAVIIEQLQLDCVTNPTVVELHRGIRLHFPKFIKALKADDIEKAQLGLGHAYSRSKIQFNSKKSDNMVIQSVALIDQLDKDINTLSMRLREWYSWHFPELSKIPNIDPKAFVQLVMLIKDKTSLTVSTVNDESNSQTLLTELTEITKDETISQQILDSARSSMGLEISDFDMLNIQEFAQRVLRLMEYRQQLYEYMQDRMRDIAPNLTSLIGEVVAARLISHAGSVINLSKYPSSTLQILGAEKALFRALKTKGNTPKYGLIYNAAFVGRASKSNKGKISRYLASKCSIASRIDAFSELTTSLYGERMKKQVEERLQHYESGTIDVNGKKNVEIMAEVGRQLLGGVEENKEESSAMEIEEPVVKSTKQKIGKSKSTIAVATVASNGVTEHPVVHAAKIAVEKKGKKRKLDEGDGNLPEAVEEGKSSSIEKAKGSVVKKQKTEKKHGDDEGGAVHQQLQPSKPKKQK